MVNIGIFASGSGTNAQNIMEYFEGHPGIRVALVLSNKPDALVLERARNKGVPVYVFDRAAFYESRQVLEVLKARGVDFLVMAGFLWLVPSYLLQAYPGRVVNIHPALLPSYGGKGMYGMHVHRAVIDAGDAESGISIHFLNEEYDRGKVIFQARCRVEKDDTPESLAARVHELEYRHYPGVIEQVIGDVILRTKGNPAGSS